MEAFFFHKPISVLEYCKGSTLQRIRQLSRNSRKIVFFVLRDRRLTVNKVTNSLLEAFPYSFFKTTQNYPSTRDPNQSDFYTVYSQKELLERLEKCPEGYCSLKLSAKTKIQIHLQHIWNLRISTKNIDLYAKITFDSIDTLELLGIDTESAAFLLRRTKKIKKLSLIRMTVDSNFLSRIQNIEDIYFNSVKFECDLFFPKLKSMTSFYSDGFSRIKAPNLQFLSVSSFFFSDEFVETLPKYTNLKELRFKTNFEMKSFAFLPRSLKVLTLLQIDLSEAKSLNLLQKCPNLIKLYAKSLSLEVNSLSNSQIRLVSTEFTGYLEDESKIKRMVIDDSNNYQFMTIPYLLDNCAYLKVNSLDFSFDYLNSFPKYLCLGKFNYESLVSNLNKLKNTKVIEVKAEFYSAIKKLVLHWSKTEKHNILVHLI